MVKGPTSIVHQGVSFQLGDSFLIRGTTSAAPYIGKLVEICESSPGDVCVQWYYRPEETYGGRKPFHGAKELFASDHCDGIHMTTVIGKAFVHPLKKYESLMQIKEHDYFARFLYKASQKEFEPDRVPIYCVCEQPYNPDRPMMQCDDCESWYHPECIGRRLDGMDQGHFSCPECVLAAAAAPGGWAPQH
ncbi:hypothetical protein FOA52_014920 [Chlamydomonas sp. UWO 241]|nr:hypothetical protein FOA52_014920 [Chlamydomonas sp. UWO 241]